MTLRRTLIWAATAAFIVSFKPGLQAQEEATPAAPQDETLAAAPAVELPEVVAEVDGEKIKREELEEALQGALSAAGRTPADLPADQRAMAYRMIAEEMVTRKIVSKKAEKIEVSEAEVEEEFASLKERFESEEQMKQQIEAAGETVEGVKGDIRESLQQQKWVDQQIGDKATVSDADVEAFYKGNPDQFKAPETVRASHILINVPTGADEDATDEAKAKAEKAKERVEGGEDFAAVATELSDDPGSKANGGDLDYFSKDRMVPEFAEAAFKLEKGKVSDPVKTQFGFHIIKVTDKKEARTVPLDEAKEQIFGFLEEQKRQTAVQEAIQEARESAEVKIHLPEPAPPGMPGAPGGVPAQDQPAAEETGASAEPAGDAPAE